MTLTRLLFEPTLMRSPLRIVGWWERRRLTYNAIVGATGLATLAWLGTIQLVVFHRAGGVPWLGVAAYGLAANVCYTMGWVVESFFDRWLHRPAYGLGPALFRYGLVFSIGLTLLPIPIVTVAAVLSRLLGR